MRSSLNSQEPTGIVTNKRQLHDPLFAFERHKRHFGLAVVRRVESRRGVPFALDLDVFAASRNTINIASLYIRDQIPDLRYGHDSPGQLRHT